MAKYRSFITAFNGISNYLHKNFKFECYADNINKFMIDYRLSCGSNPSLCMHKNAEYIQRNFKPFAEYCKNKLEHS